MKNFFKLKQSGKILEFIRRTDLIMSYNRSVRFPYISHYKTIINSNNKNIYNNIFPELCELSLQSNKIVEIVFEVRD